MTAPKNLFAGEEARSFYVWVDPSDWLIQHSVGLIGTIVATSATYPSDDNLMFLPNKNFSGAVSPYHNNILKKYSAEYNLEIHRKYSFSQYPSRLGSIFLLNSLEDGVTYFNNNQGHVGKRVLKEVVTNGPYLYSIHDQGWFEFMTGGGYLQNETINAVTSAYWRGVHVKDYNLEHFGKPWSRDYVPEVLFLGRVDFPDKNLNSCLHRGEV